MIDTTENPTIEAKNLRRSFKEIEAVAGISFRVQQGEIFGLLGPNIASRTTTIQILTSLVRSIPARIVQPWLVAW